MVQSPYRISTILQCPVHMLNLQLPVFLLGDDDLGTVVKGSHHTKLVVKGVVQGEMEVLVCVGRFPP